MCPRDVERRKGSMSLCNGSQAFGESISFPAKASISFPAEASISFPDEAPSCSPPRHCGDVVRQEGVDSQAICGE